MSFKNPSSNCCCVGCDSAILAVNTGIVNQINFAAIQCLGCMPFQLCFSVGNFDGYLDEFAGTPRKSMFQRQEQCDSHDPRRYSYWSGYLLFGDGFHAARVDFAPDAYGGCALVLTCPDLNIDSTAPEAYFQITTEIQQSWSPHCQVCVDPYAIIHYATWVVTDPLYGNQAYLIRAYPVGNTSLTPTELCLGCPTDCAQEFLYDHAFDYPGNVSCSVCLGCDCIASQMCIIVRHGGHVVESSIATICNQWVGNNPVTGEPETLFFWRTGLGTTIFLYGDPTDHTCQVVLENVRGLGGSDVDAYLSSLGLAVNIAGQCPDIFASWQIFDPTHLGYNQLFITMSALECGECSAMSSIPCCDEAVSRLLYATIDGGLCTCGQIIVPIVENTIVGDVHWSGTSDIGEFQCYGEGVYTNYQVQLELFCSGSTFSLFVNFLVNGIVVKTDSSNYYVGQCSPLSLTFSLSGSGLGDCVCEPPFFPKCENITVRITE